MNIMCLDWWIWRWSSRISRGCYHRTFIYSAISAHWRVQEPTNWHVPCAASCTVQQCSIKDSGKKRIQQSKHQSLGSVTAVVPLVHPALFTFCEELDDRVLKAPQFASPRPSDCETVISLGMNQMPWNNKPTGGIIVSSPCNQHSRLMRQKMKTSACENLLALFKVPKEKQTQTGSDSHGDHVNLIRPRMENEILDVKCSFFLQNQ